MKKLFLFALNLIAISTSYSACPFKDTFYLEGISDLTASTLSTRPFNPAYDSKLVTSNYIPSNPLSKLIYYPRFIISEGAVDCIIDSSTDKNNNSSGDWTSLIPTLNGVIDHNSDSIVKVKIGYDANNYCTLDIQDGPWSYANVNMSACVGSIAYSSLEKISSASGENEFYLHFKMQ